MICPNTSVSHKTEFQKRGKADEILSRILETGTEAPDILVPRRFKMGERDNRRIKKEERGERQYTSCCFYIRHFGEFFIPERDFVYIRNIHWENERECCNNLSTVNFRTILSNKHVFQSWPVFKNSAIHEKLKPPPQFIVREVGKKE